MKALVLFLSLLTALQILTGCTTTNPTQGREVSSSNVVEEENSNEQKETIPANLGPQTRSLHNGLR